MFWIGALVFLAGLPLAAEVGFLLYSRLADRAEGDDGGAGHLASGALALLGLLIGFTFAMSAERYEARRELVVQEANAIGTTYLRDRLLGAPADASLSALVMHYASEREAYFEAGDDPAALAASSRRTAVLQARIWDQTGRALRVPAAAPLTTAVLNATNEMFDLAASREAAREARVPRPVLWAVIACAFGAALLSGYALAASRRRHRPASSLLFVLVGLSLLVILDMDRPRGGLIQAPQSPLKSVVDSLSASEQASPLPARTPPQMPP